jgi:hypothetical protein
MKFIVATALVGAVAVCATSMVAGRRDMQSAQVMTDIDAGPTYRHLMAQCMDKQKQQDSTASMEEMQKICNAQVRAQLRTQGQLPPASASPSSPSSSGDEHDHLS